MEVLLQVPSVLPPASYLKLTRQLYSVMLSSDFIQEHLDLQSKYRILLYSRLQRLQHALLPLCCSQNLYTYE